MGTDFNGDGRDDILWRKRDDGALSDWLGKENGGFTINDANAMIQVSASWHVAGTGDFNGDGRDDILWQNFVSGRISDWLGTASGGFVNNDANAFRQTSPNEYIAGIGDFNGDGRDDILWRGFETGVIADWLGTASGGFAYGAANAGVSIAVSWNIVGTGDFNGDGRDDILLRHSGTGALSNWLGTVSGGLANNDANAMTQVPLDWMVVGTGDFNGDGRDDILWRNNNGSISDWLGTANGGFAVNDANAFSQVPNDWRVVETGDYNGDGRDDILWRHSDGWLSNWLGKLDGGFFVNDAAALTSVSTEWVVMPNPSGAGEWDY